MSTNFGEAGFRVRALAETRHQRKSRERILPGRRRMLGVEYRRRRRGLSLRETTEEWRQIEGITREAEGGGGRHLQGKTVRTCEE